MSEFETTKHAWSLSWLYHRWRAVWSSWKVSSCFNSAALFSVRLICLGIVVHSSASEWNSVARLAWTFTTLSFLSLQDQTILEAITTSLEYLMGNVWVIVIGRRTQRRRWVSRADRSHHTRGNSGMGVLPRLKSASGSRLKKKKAWPVSKGTIAGNGL